MGVRIIGSRRTHGIVWQYAGFCRHEWILERTTDDMNKSDKSLPVTDETNNTTVVVKKRGRKKLDESAVAAQELPVTPENAVSAKRGRKKAMPEENLASEAVSYTHLDVYKRQDCTSMFHIQPWHKTDVMAVVFGKTKKFFSGICSGLFRLNFCDR